MPEPHSRMYKHTLARQHRVRRAAVLYRRAILSYRRTRRLPLLCKLVAALRFLAFASRCAYTFGEPGVTTEAGGIKVVGVREIL